MTARWAPPKTLLGLLQRGRGLGWLQAAADPDVGRVQLAACLDADPCWDQQIESRATYYATLALRLEMPAGDLVQRGDGTDARLERLLEEVAVKMLHRGDVSGVRMLHRRLVEEAFGRDWLLTLLARAARPEALEGVRELLVEHLGDDELQDLIHESEEVPWRRWAELSPRIQTLYRSSVPNRRPTSLPPPPPLDGPLETLLTFAWTRAFPKQLTHRFRNLLTEDEVEQARRAARTGPGWPRLTALRALGERGDPSAVDVAEEIIRSDIGGRDRGTATRYLKAVDPSVTLPLARAWLGANDNLHGAATSVLARHGEPGDVPAVRTALAEAWRTREMYDLCSLIDALGRHPGLGPFPELTQVFEAVEYSYARHLAAPVLLASDPDFVRSYGGECLWDSEGSIRELGASVAPIDRITRDRLHELAADALEDSDVRNAATARLGAQDPAGV